MVFHLALRRKPKIAVCGVLVTETALSRLVTLDSIKQSQHEFLLTETSAPELEFKKSRQEIILAFNV